MKQKTKLPWWGWIGGVCLLQVLYVFSIFPVLWIVRQFRDMGDAPMWFLVFYTPVTWAMGEWDWFAKFIGWGFERMGL